MIPKIIHYCWLSGDPYPRKIQYCIESWKKHLPDYEFVLWDKNRFDINSCAWVKQAYEAKKYAFAADYIRLYALYHYGGIYLDSDVEVLKSFDPLLKQSYFFGTEDSGKLLIEAATMGTEPYNEYIGRCLNYYKDRQFYIKGKLDILPLPDIMASYVDNYKIIKSENDFTLNDDNILNVFTKDYFSPKSGVGGELSYFTANTYSIHHYNASWYPPHKKLYTFILGCTNPWFANKLSIMYKTILGILNK